MSFVSLNDLPSVSTVNSLFGETRQRLRAGGDKKNKQADLGRPKKKKKKKKGAAHPVSLSSCSCSVMKHSSHTDRYSMTTFASFLYALPMAPLLASN